MLAMFVAASVAGLMPLVTHAAGAAEAATTTTPSTSTTPTLRWKRCARGLQCATLSVPVDYTQPDGEQVKLAVSRRQATDPSRRLGSLVMNFGGPGDAGSTTLADFVDAVPAEIRARYDLVSFDPRGVGKSRPVVCTDGPTTDALDAEDPTPNSDADLPDFYAQRSDVVDFVGQCVAKNGAWLGQLGSRNVARDVDRLRAALGDDRLTYLGYSYGTVIGAVYAQMFPDRVGRLVLDAPVDLSADALSELRGNAQGFETALTSFLADCAHKTDCPFHSSGDPTAAFRNLQARFERGDTLSTTTANGKRSSRKAGVAAFYTAVISALYDKDYGWPELSQALEDARSGDGTLLLELADSYNGRRDDGTYDNIDQVIGSILCDDRFDPSQTYDEFVAEYRAQVSEYPLLGGYTGSTKLGCDPRLPQPPASEQLGDVRATGTKPILVVGTTRDPATPYSGARDLVSRLDGSRLLTFDSTEHTAYTKSACIDAAVDAYLLRGTLPAKGSVCRS
jgi:pimeloyl-ACP methyl ester carboxylesterase